MRKVNPRGEYVLSSSDMAVSCSVKLSQMQTKGS